MKSIPNNYGILFKNEGSRSFFLVKDGYQKNETWNWGTLWYSAQCYVARRRREKNFSFGWDTYIGPSALEPPAGLGGGLKCSPGVGGSKMASRGVDWLLAPPTPTYESHLTTVQDIIEASMKLQIGFIAMGGKCVAE